MSVFFDYFPIASLVINKIRYQATTNMVLEFINELKASTNLWKMAAYIFVRHLFYQQTVVYPYMH